MNEAGLASTFAAAAQNLCDILEHQDLTDIEAFDELHRLLVQVYGLALELPLSAENTTEEDWPDISSRSRNVFGRISRAFGQRTFYRLVYDPYKEEPAVSASVADDLSGIFDDLERGLSFWRQGRVPNAVWEWRFGLEHHWGQHFINVLHALQWLRFSYGLPSWVPQGGDAA